MGWLDRLRGRRTDSTPNQTRNKSVPASSSDGGPSAARVLERYFSLLEQHGSAHSDRDYQRLLDVCTASVEMLPAAVDAFNVEYAGHTVTIPPSIPALDDLGHLAAAHQHRELLALLERTVSSRPDLAEHQAVVDRTVEHLRLTGEVLGLVRIEPGVVQSALGKRLGVHGRQTRTVVLWLDRTGHLDVVAEGKHKRLYMAGAAPTHHTPSPGSSASPDTAPVEPTAVPIRHPRETPSPTPPARADIENCPTGTFAAIDFETATGLRASACALAVTHIDDGKVTGSRSWLIRPPGNKYDSFNTYLHGIGPDDTAGAPGFLDVMDQALELIGDRPVIAHYAAFDLGVLRESYLAAGVPWPSMQLGCTVVLGRRIWPGLSSYSLPVIAAWLGLDRFTHHNAAADSRVCADIARAAIVTSSADTLDDAAETVGVRFGRLEPELYEPCRALWKSASPHLVAPDPASLDPNHPLHGANVSFTGTLWSMTRRDAAQVVIDAGGQFNQNPGRKTDYLVFGQQDFTRFVDGDSSAKTKRALALIADGYPLQIVEEADFRRML